MPPGEPLRVCVIAFAISSPAACTTSSRPGEQASRHPTNARASWADSGVPANARRHTISSARGPNVRSANASAAQSVSVTAMPEPSPAAPPSTTYRERPTTRCTQCPRMRQNGNRLIGDLPRFFKCDREDFMAAGHSPTLRSRRLRAHLRKLREEHGLTLAQAAKKVDWTGAKLSRIENGQRGVHPNDVRALADVYGVTGEEREALITLAREARQRGWWQPYGSALPYGFATYVGLESEASSIATYEPELIPGLMQSEDYARAQMRAAPIPEPEEEIDKRVAVRM